MATAPLGNVPAPLGFGVIGARSMVAELAVLPGIVASDRLALVAVASLGGAVKAPWNSVAVSTYEEVIDHPDVEAVYIPLPNGLHAYWAERCAEAGKAVLCEKPIAPTASAAAQMATTAAAHGTILCEAWMTPFDARWAAAIKIARSGALGAVEAIHTAFTFTIGPEAASNYRWDPGLGGGALLDVGIYCLGPAVALWGAEPDSIVAEQALSDRGVDATTTATLNWGDRRTATIRCSFAEEEQQSLRISGAKSSLVIDGDVHTGGADPSLIRLIPADGSPPTITASTVNNPYVAMLEAFADAVRGLAEWPRPLAESTAMLGLLDNIRNSAAR